MPGIIECRDAVFLALALEFFLDGFEIRHARRNLFALPSEALAFFHQAHPFFESCPISIGL